MASGSRIRVARLKQVLEGTPPVLQKTSLGMNRQYAYNSCTKPEDPEVEGVGVGKTSRAGKIHLV